MCSTRHITRHNTESKTNNYQNRTSLTAKNTQSTNPRQRSQLLANLQLQTTQPDTISEQYQPQKMHQQRSFLQKRTLRNNAPRTSHTTRHRQYPDTTRAPTTRHHPIKQHHQQLPHHLYRLAKDKLHRLRPLTMRRILKQNRLNRSQDPDRLNTSHTRPYPHLQRRNTFDNLRPVPRRRSTRINPQMTMLPCTMRPRMRHLIVIHSIIPINLRTRRQSETILNRTPRTTQQHIHSSLSLVNHLLRRRLAPTVRIPPTRLSHIRITLPISIRRLRRIRRRR